MPRARISMTFEPTGDTCALTVSRHGTCFWEGRPCATKCKTAKRTLKELEGSE